MIIQSFAGFIVFAAIAWAMSENPRKVHLKTIIIGMTIQLAVGFLLIKLPVFREFFLFLNRMVLFLEQSTQAGTSMVFGYLGGGSLPFDEKFPGSSFILAFRALPLILLMSALSALLFHWKILPFIVQNVSKFMEKTMKLGGAEALGVSANIFVGMVESPLFIRPYLKDMTRSEIFTLMTCGMATIAGTVLVLYASILSSAIPDIMGHILTASIISVPAAVTISKIIIPETGEITSGELVYPEKVSGSMDAISKGTVQGVELLINVIAMLIVLVALVHLINLFMGLLPQIGGQDITLQKIMGYIMAPIVWLMGVPWNEALTAGALMGTKTIINEFVAYLDLSRLPEGVLSAKSRIIMVYAMCGFANPGSLGIMIGGMGTMAPEKRDEIVSLGFRSIIAGTLSTCMTGAVVGILSISG
ncbi:nucleoside transporter C-terminal domain-containing protein [Desulfobacterales bacterium HSG17]|nr:nucleoside transporter C-terminal domain-containing protein [Desulfobacterales bacterium HSG17]